MSDKPEKDEPSDQPDEQESDEMSDEPDLPGLDPDQFVGSPPAGDAHPGDFVSNDQSVDPTDAAGRSEDA